MGRRWIVGLALALPAPLAAQAAAYGCDGPEARALDFWVGEWELTFLADGKPAKSRNRITKVLGGCVILEEFSGPPGTPLEGRSLSTFDRVTKRWRQTWVDNTASYLDFDGRIEDGRMVFSRAAVRDGKPIRQRMVFTDVKADSLKWLWQRSEDDGRTWTTAWEIDYLRVK